MLFLHKPKPVTFTLAIDALWEWETDRRHGKEDPWGISLPWRRNLALLSQDRADRSGCSTNPILPFSSMHLHRAGEGSGGESTLGGHCKAMSCLTLLAAESTARKEDAGAACDKAVRRPCRQWSRAARPPSRSWQRWLSPGSAGKEEDGGPQRPGVDCRRATLRP